MGKKRKKERVNVIYAAGQPPFTSKGFFSILSFKKKCQVHGPSDKICMLFACVKMQALSLSLLQTTTTTVLSQLQSVSNFELLTKRNEKP
jgi:hypothetical protein